MMVEPTSFEADDRATSLGRDGQVAHRSLIDHGEHFERRLWSVSPGVWCLVGNGLSNQTFVEGPEGIIAIDTGESVEEMQAALDTLREHTDRPIVAVVYTHFHYCNGTRAVFADAGTPLPVHGHADIPTNLARVGGEVGPAARRGLIEQFGILLPDEGADAVVNVGLGRAYRDPAHAPFTPGYVAPDHPITTETVRRIAGLEVAFRPSPSDADDNLTLWFPALGVCVQNLVWPALFNVFPVRGEEYRDPRVLLDGIDHIVALGAEHLVGAHGPPISGAERVRSDAVLARDAIQFLWDQTVRALNQGLRSSEIGARVQLPEVYNTSMVTRQHYGLAEHHARQIHAGLRGWFDGDPAQLFPLSPAERAVRMIDGWGGLERVRAVRDEALGRDDLRWALEVAGWVVDHDGATDADRAAQAAVLRAIGQRTMAANIRNWALTRARELEGHIDLSRHRDTRPSRRAVLAARPSTTVAALRIRVDPDAAVGFDHHVGFVVDGERCGLHLRHCVAVPTDGSDAETVLTCTVDQFAAVLSGEGSLGAIVADGATITGELRSLLDLGAALELPGLMG